MWSEIFFEQLPSHETGKFKIMSENLAPFFSERKDRDFAVFKYMVM